MPAPQTTGIMDYTRSWVVIACSIVGQRDGHYIACHIESRVGTIVLPTDAIGVLPPGQASIGRQNMARQS